MVDPTTSLSTTDISELPNLNNSPGYSQKTTQKIRNNIILETKELKPPPQNPPPTGMLPGAGPGINRLPKETIAEITREVRSAMASGGTELPQRDIPMNQQQYVQDEQIQPNYIPQEDEDNYIDDEYERREMIKEKRRRKRKKKQEDIYDELQTPVFVMVLFFIFQLPFITNLLKRHFPSFFFGDHNITLGCQFFKTVMFGLCFFGLQRGLKYLTEWNSKMNRILADDD